MTTDVALMVFSMGGGGVERMRINLAGELLRRGFATSIVVARSDGHWGRNRSRIPPGVTFVDFEAHSWKAWRSSFQSYLKSERPRVVLAAMETAGVTALWARRRASASTRIVVSSHVELSRHTKQDWPFSKRLVMTYLMRRLYRHADGVVAVSDGVADDLARFARLPRKKITVINNPVVTEHLLEAKNQLPDHPWLSDVSDPLMIAVGRLTKQKDFGTLLRAFALMRQQRPARLMILGEGEDRSSLEALARDLGIEQHVQMPGFVPDPLSYVSKASVFVLSSAWEGFGNAIVEALACGCPVVSTDCPSGPREVLGGGEYGRLVAVGDHQALSEAVLDVLKNPLASHELTKRAMEFHVDKIVDQYLAVMGLSDEVVSEAPEARRVAACG
ncbi:MAG: glycosyltransferase [Geminicoccaceae bacterium]